MPTHSRSTPGRLFGLTHKTLAIIGGVLLLVIVGVVVGVTVGGSGKSTPTATGGGSGASSGSSRTALPVLGADRCPLTDLPAPGGVVPKRPALLVKIGNEPQGARPQSGLNEADIVFDTPAEGFIMRYIAVYQCGNASSIGPTRSVRWVDYHIAREFPHPILAFAGGIDPNVDAVMASSWLSPANLLAGASAAGERISSRVPPDNLYTSTSALYGLNPNDQKVPRPIFTYTASLPAGAKPVADAAINFSGGTDVIWKWDAASGSFVHTYSGATDVDALTNAPVTTTNIVIQVVNYTIGPYIESTGGTGDIESQTVGTGTGYILRDGKMIKVTWNRPELIDPTTYTDASGASVGLAPGRTWVELVPNTVAGSISFTP